MTQLAALLAREWMALTPFSLPAAEDSQCPQCPCGLSLLAPVGAGLGDAAGICLCFVGLLVLAVFPFCVGFLFVVLG